MRRLPFSQPCFLCWHLAASKKAQGQEGDSPAKSEAVGLPAGSVLSILLSSGSRSMGTSLRGRLRSCITREWYCTHPKRTQQTDTPHIPVCHPVHAAHLPVSRQLHILPTYNQPLTFPYHTKSPRMLREGVGAALTVSALLLHLRRAFRVIRWYVSRPRLNRSTLSLASSPPTRAERGGAASAPGLCSPAGAAGAARGGLRHSPAESGTLEKR